MTDFRADRAVRTWTQHIAAPPDAVFPLLCPVREYEWIPTWSCELVYSEGGVIEDNCVFRTDMPDRGPELWVVAGRDAAAHTVGFVVVRGDAVVLKHDVSLQAEGPGRTSVRWVSTFTGLTEAGNAQVAAVTEQAYEAQLTILGKLLDHYCRTGAMLGAAS